jgi:hypothetical protein
VINEWIGRIFGVKPERTNEELGEVMNTTKIVALVAVAIALFAAAGAAGRPAAGPLPVARIEQALEAKGTVAEHVLSIEIDRDELAGRHIHGVPISASFQINGALTFQPLAGGRALFNGDFPLRSSEINRFIDALIANGIVFQAEHQHFYDLTPPTWFIHFRAIGDPVAIAQAVHTAMRTTSVHLPQAPPSSPHTPLNVGRLKTILGTKSAQVGAGGVVTLTLTQKHPVHLGGVLLNQSANADTNIVFEPLDKTGSRVAVAPDFGMTAGQIQGVMGVMRRHGWDIGCLYNQETDESPQLYFSHDFKVGDPYRLAQEIRDGLDRMNVT